MRRFLSRKFLMALAAGALVVANQGLGLNLPTDHVLAVVGVAISYILGEAHVDGKGAGS